MKRPIYRIILLVLLLIIFPFFFGIFWGKSPSSIIISSIIFFFTLNFLIEIVFRFIYRVIYGQSYKLIKKVSSNTVWEELASYSRAIKYKDRILVSGTTSTLEDKLIGGADAAAQAHFIIDKIEASIQSLGGNLNDIIKTRIFIKNLADWEKVAKAHGERFKGIMPVNTLVQANLIGDEYLVEIEAEAIISDKPK